jgi:methylglutaconyl-CoA hydratase
MADKIVESAVDRRGVATVSLSRPEKNNAYDGEMIGQLAATLGALAADDRARVIVLRGAGRHFQAGADLAWVQSVRSQSAAANIAISQRTAAAIHALTALPKPTVALVHGGCFGGGTGIAAACDIVLADASAMFSISEARWGLTAVPIVPQLLSRIGPGRLRRYALSCERFGAQRAFEIGLVDEVCEEGGLDALAAPIIDALLHVPPGALAESKESVLKYAGLYYTQQELLEMARPHGLKRLSDEAGEGLASFLEKREPAWYPGAGNGKSAKAPTKALKAAKDKGGTSKAAKKSIKGEKASRKK